MYFRFRQKNGQGLEELKELLCGCFCGEGQIYIERLVPYDQAGSIARIRKNMDRWCRKNSWQMKEFCEGLCRWRFTVRSEKRRKKEGKPYSKVLFPLFIRLHKIHTIY